MAVTNNGYQRQDLARHPMVVALASALASVLLAGLLAALGWLVVNVSDLKAGQERLSIEMDGINQEVAGIRRDIADLKAGQERLSNEIRALVSSQPPTE